MEPLITLNKVNKTYNKYSKLKKHVLHDISLEINKNDFGRLTVLPDDKIYANVNHAEIGVMGKDTIASVLYKEMTEGHSWLRIRDQKPCCDCIYQWLCPSPSNYELAIGKPNLCHVKP